MKNPASHVLALLARRFGDPRYYAGSCYKAPGRHSAGQRTEAGLPGEIPVLMRRLKRI